MDRVLHTANALVNLAALVTASGPVAAAGAGVAGLLSWRAIRAMPPAAPELAAELARDMAVVLDAHHASDDQRALIPQMIEAALPDPATIIGARLDAVALTAQMEAALTDREHRLDANLTLFRVTLRPALTRLLTDPEFTATLAPAFMRAVLAGIGRIDYPTQDTHQIVSSMQKKIDALLQQRGTDRDAALADLRDIAAELKQSKPHRADWAELVDYVMNKVRSQAEALARIEAQAAGLGIDNLRGEIAELFAQRRYAEADARFDDLLRMEEEEGELRRRLERQAFALEGKAEIALQENRVDDAYLLLCRAADSFSGTDPLEPARRRINAYFGLLHNHGLRFGGLGLAMAEAIIQPALTEALKNAECALWAKGRMLLGIAIAEQYMLRHDPEAIRKLEQAVYEYGLALDAYSDRKDAPDRSLVLQNRAIALKALGQRYDRGRATQVLFQAIKDFERVEQFFAKWPDSPDYGKSLSNKAGALLVLSAVVSPMVNQAILRQAETTCRKAIPLLTDKERRRSWAIAQRNLGHSLLGQSSHCWDRSAAQEKAMDAQRAFKRALEVSTRSDDPIDWARLQQSLARTELFLGCLGCLGADEDLTDHVHSALAYVSCALKVLDPEHTPLDYDAATALRDHLRKALGGGARLSPGLCGVSARSCARPHPTPTPTTKKAASRGRRLSVSQSGQDYLILPSLYSTCLRTTGSYFRIDIFSVMVRAFFLVT